MEATVYRKGLSAKTPMDELLATGDAGPMEDTTATPLSPDLFYPSVTEQEMEVWTHWLPTEIMFDGCGFSCASVSKTLARLNAPPEVLEEFRWAWSMDLFDAYQVRTPVRRDARDPLLLGRLGNQWYRIALWGESLLPLERITALVEKSSALRRRAYKRRVWLLPLSGLGLVCSMVAILWGLAEQSQSPVIGLCVLAVSIASPVVLVSLVSTPENCQQDFLDRYRR